MAQSKQSDLEKDPPAKSWVYSLASVIRRTGDIEESRMKTVLSCDLTSSKPGLYVPPDMAELQPQSLRYLQMFAKVNELRLVEDRRRVEVQPIVENRDRKPPTIALGLSMLLKQTGLPGKARSLSSPHRLNADSPHIGITRLIEMAEFSADQSKRVVMLPNKFIVDVLDNDTQPISAYACKLSSANSTTVLSHFDSPYFRAIGYSAGEQYVVHACLAGGPLHSPRLWTHLHTLSRTDFRFQLFPAKKAAHDFGLFYATFYFDLKSPPAPWWIDNVAEVKNKPANSATIDEEPSVRRAG